jgi:hypothetical protein
MMLSTGIRTSQVLLVSGEGCCPRLARACRFSDNIEQGDENLRGMAERPVGRVFLAVEEG